MSIQGIRPEGRGECHYRHCITLRFNRTFMKVNPAFAFLVLVFSLQVSAQQKNKSNQPPGLASITLADLKRQLYEHADPHFNGRSAGTLDELKASAWFAEKMREAGLSPAGDDGTYFQFFSLWRNRIGPSSAITIGGRNLKIWKDVLIAQTAPANLS